MSEITYYIIKYVGDDSELQGLYYHDWDWDFKTNKRVPEWSGEDNAYQFDWETLCAYRFNHPELAEPHTIHPITVITVVGDAVKESK